MSNDSGGTPIVAIFFVIMVGIFAFFCLQDTDSGQETETQLSSWELKEKQNDEAEEYTKKVVEELKADEATIDMGSNVGSCTYKNVVNQLAKVDKTTWTTADTKQKLTAALKDCREEEEKARKRLSKQRRI